MIHIKYLSLFKAKNVISCRVHLITFSGFSLLICFIKFYLKSMNFHCLHITNMFLVSIQTVLNKINIELLYLVMGFVYVRICLHM